jgi:hypothetical protein
MCLLDDNARHRRTVAKDDLEHGRRFDVERARQRANPPSGVLW